jgi:hypothetical protein
MPIHKGIFSAVSDVLSLADAVRRRVSGQRDVGMTWVNRGAYGTSPVVTGIGPLRRLATRPSAMPTTQAVGTSVIGDLAGGERKVLSRANTLRGKVKTLATASGFACKKKC